jgi:hypothetical protein
MNGLFEHQSVVVIDNFFNDFALLAGVVKEIPVFAHKDHPEPMRKNEFWPGKRSSDLIHANPFFCALYLETLRTKLGVNRSFNFSMYTHLRTKDTDEKDFCHQDDCFVSGLVYLSDTNLKSGTAFYDRLDGDVITTVNFVQNRAVFFKGDLWHRTFGAHGESMTDGRLTLNSFIFV